MGKHTWLIIGLVLLFLYMNGSLTTLLTPKTTTS